MKVGFAPLFSLFPVINGARISAIVYVHCCGTQDFFVRLLETGILALQGVKEIFFKRSRNRSINDSAANSNVFVIYLFLVCFRAMLWAFSMHQEGAAPRLLLRYTPVPNLMTPVITLLHRPLVEADLLTVYRKSFNCLIERVPCNTRVTFLTCFLKNELSPASWYSVYPRKVVLRRS